MTKLVDISLVEEMIKKATPKDVWREWETIHKNQLAKELLESIKLLPTQNEWIPVSERLPEPGTDCIVNCTTGFIALHIARYHSDGFYTPKIVGESFLSAPKGGITHWMPLPLPPTN